MGIILSILSGLLLCLSFTYSNLWWICFVGLVPLFYVILKNRYGFKKFSLYMLGFGVGYYVPLLMWMYELSEFFPDGVVSSKVLISIFVVLIAIVETFYIVISTFVFPKLRRGNCLDILIFSSLYIVAEFLQEVYVKLSFPWGKIGVIPNKFTAFIQSASLFGTIFISFLVLIVNGFIAYGIIHYKDTKKLRIAVSIVTGVFIVNTGFGLIRINISEENDEKFEVVLVQGNYSGGDKWLATPSEMVDGYLFLSKEALTEDTKLVVWPETAVSENIDKSEIITNKLKEFCIYNRVTLVTGVIYADEEFEYNSMRIINEYGDISEPYHKQALVPFGEFVPFKDVLNSISEDFGGYIDNYDNYTHGNESIVLESSVGKVGGVICYESIYPKIVRESARSGAEIISIISNDSWFGDSAALYQHLSHGVMRAVENNRYVVRSSNTGITAVVSPNGKLLETAEPFVPTYIRAEVSSNSKITLYTLIGDVIVIPGMLFYMYGIILLIVSFIKRVRK